MATGLKRSLLGIVFLGVAAFNAAFLNKYEDMSPNEMADDRISEWQRTSRSALEQAIHYNTGPVYEESVRECNAKQQAAIMRAEGISKQLDVKISSPSNFNHAACVQDRLSWKVWVSEPIPEPGKADEAYKQREMGSAKSGMLGFGQLGLGLLLWGTLRRHRHKASVIQKPTIEL